MKILVFSYDWLNNYYFAGGAPKRIYNVYKILSERYNAEIELITGATPNSRNKYEKINENFTINYVGFKKPLLISAMSYSFISTIDSIKGKEYDIVANHIAPHIPTATYLLPGINRKTVYIIHNYYSKIYFKKYKLMGILPFVNEKLMYKYGKYFIAVSEYIENQIKKENKDVTVKTIYNGIDDHLFETPKQDPIIDKDYILYFGRLEIYQKGLDILLKAYKDLDIDDVYLVFAGGGKKQHLLELKNLVKKMDLENKVIIKYKVSEQEKISLIDNCLFGVMPSRYEAFPITLLEFMARGRPLIVSKAGCMGEVIERSNSGLVIDLSEEALKTAIKKMLSMNLTELSKNAKDFSKNFRWDKIAKEEYNFYKEILRE